ncbi:hypothetical protein Poli38472_000420 [Pythium oligandrum]|uniref:3'-5' exonuclease domain-containing protein n=1 Tax=Pythium oligandrum TaxID=41045 RepID=A0A8K1CCA7_PYTOL|nr:hypothetical protein Poli38472_000420 [Pythium oligandrum]|eukprot:TMW60378.1 hypothetical protein Poli38472_000420 [Pythium oligandrum]
MEQPEPPLDAHSPPPPQVSALAELFLNHNTPRACQLLQETPEELLSEELHSAFACVPWATDAFLHTMTQWPHDTASDKFLAVIDEAIRCVYSIPYLQVSPVTSDLAGIVLVSTFPDCSQHIQLIAFIQTFRVNWPHIQQFGCQLAHRDAIHAVRLLEMLSLLHLLPFEVLIDAAIRQRDLYAVDTYVAHFPAFQRPFVQAIILSDLPDQFVKKRMLMFRFNQSDFPEYRERKLRGSIRYCILNEMYDDALVSIEQNPSLSFFAANFVIERKGPEHPVTRLFIHLAGLGAHFPQVDTSDQEGKSFPNRDDLKPLPGCLSVVDLIGESNIVFVDTQEALDACFKDLLQSDVVGFDCEWKANTSGYRHAPCAVLQLASASRAYVIDMLALRGQDLGAIPLFFSSNEVLKLGFHAKGDLNALRDMLPSTHSSRTLTINRLVDLQAVAKQMVHTQWQAAKSDSDSGSQVNTKSVERSRQVSKGTTVSLATLVQEYLGRPLDKRARMSNWERRPLTRAQLHYAALDAYALVAIYHKMQDEVPSDVLVRILNTT